MTSLPPDTEVAVKTAKLTQIEKQSDSGRRLVEYFCVISSVERKAGDANKTDVSQSEWKTESADYEYEDEFVDYRFVPQITARYPLTDHPDNPLHENVTFFCHPSGNIQLRTEPYMPKIHFFVATGGTAKQMFGTCLTLWESYFLTMKDGNEREVYLPKNLVILSTYPYLIAFREYLTQLNQLRQYGEMTLPIERYIVNFCAEIPAPPPGSCEVQTTILDSVIRIWSPPHNLPIAWVSLPFANTFECLDIDNIILVWHCLVLERQVLITSTQLSVLTTTCEIFLSLLFPMRWSHAYIPVLPTFMIPILSAPMPFLCGINKANLADALYDLSRDCVLVDLDKNTVTLGPDTQALPPLPPGQEAVLRGQLEDNVGMVFREVRSLTKNDDYSESGTYLSSDVKMRAEAMWESKLCLLDEAFHLYFTPEEARKNHLNGNDSSGLDHSDREMNRLGLSMQNDNQNKRSQSAWDAVQEAFLDTCVYLLRNYRKYLVFPSKHNEGSYGGAGFRSKEFIESQRYDMREFLQQLIGTQMFDNFITKRLYGSGEADVAFFDMAVDRFLKNAGLFADVDIGGRIMSSVKAADKRSTLKPKLVKRATTGNSKPNDSPLLQSARVHRKLKTIVPPEPTGEGLPEDILFGLENVTSMDDNDDSSVHSNGTASTTGTRRSQQSSLSSRNIMEKSGSNSRKNRMFAYPIFPSDLNQDLFGSPRPLSSVVIAEFDRQRKDAAQFRRKNKRRDATKHIQHARSTVDVVIPPSPEVATFTVFFMAFSAMVGRELTEKVIDDSGNQEKTILSTYVPTTCADSDTESETATNDGSEVDEEERQGVAQMKTSRPAMRNMFSDDDDDSSKLSNDQFDDVDVASTTSDITMQSQHSKSAEKVKKQTKVKAMTTESNNGVKTDSGKPRERFRDRLSDLEIEEAKATGRAQLALAFEILTMMKKRALKADPEAYQVLIDACGRVGDTKRATELLGKMHEDGIVADGTVYACLVSAFSAESAWKDTTQQEDLPEWANSTAVEMDWNRLQKRSFIDRLIGQQESEDSDDDNSVENLSSYQKIRKRIMKHRRGESNAIGLPKNEDAGMEFFVTETVERQIALGENLLEIVFPDISVDTENEVCPRCNYLLSDDDVVAGWTPDDSQDYTTSCPNCTQRFVPHFCVQSSAQTFVGSRGAATPLMCERLSPWVLQKEIRSVMSDIGGINNLVDPDWRSKEYKNSVLWWNLVLSCMRYRLPFSFLLQGSFEQQLIAPMPEDDN